MYHSPQTMTFQVLVSLSVSPLSSYITTHLFLSSLALFLYFCTVLSFCLSCFLSLSIYISLSLLSLTPSLSLFSSLAVPLSVSSNRIFCLVFYFLFCIISVLPVPDKCIDINTHPVSFCPCIYLYSYIYTNQSTNKSTIYVISIYLIT